MEIRITETPFPATMMALQRDSESEGAKVLFESLDMITTIRLCMKFNPGDTNAVRRCIASVMNRMKMPQNHSFLKRALSRTFPDGYINRKYNEMLRADSKTIQAMKRDGIIK